MNLATASPAETKEDPTDDRLLLLYQHDYFRRHELLLEYKNLRNPGHCPPGMYVLPTSPDTLHVWKGVYFVQPEVKSPYAGGIFHFLLLLPLDYPAHGPQVRFLTRLFHPLVEPTTGNLQLNRRFPKWRPHHDYICHVLHFITHLFRDDLFLSGDSSNGCNNSGDSGKSNNSAVQDYWHPEAEALRRQDWPMFKRLAEQCAHVSSAEGVIYEPEDAHLQTLEPGEVVRTGIRFHPLTETQFRQIKEQALGGVEVEEQAQTEDGDETVADLWTSLRQLRDSWASHLNLS